MTGLKSAPLVAIATPVYNGARFLAETMECVQAQTYPNLVHCVLDNASTDGTAEIIERYRGGRVRLIAARNAETLPQVQNWNAALRLVPKEAAYFRTLPHDDLILADGIEKMVALGERRPEVGIIGCHEWIGERLEGADLPAGREVLDGRAIVRGALLNVTHGFSHDHSLFRMPPDGMPEHFYDAEYYGTPLLSFDTDAGMRALVRGSYGCVHEPLGVTRLHPESVTSVEVTPIRLKLWADLQLIDRWGPKAFDSEAEYRACRSKHLGFYFRHLLLYKIRGRSELLKRHMNWLARASVLPTKFDYARAVVEWPFRRAMRRLRPLGARLRILPQQYPYSRTPSRNRPRFSR